MTKNTDIPMTVGLAEFTPKDWEDREPKPVIRCIIPDFEQRDLFYSVLHARGVRYNGKDQQRAVMRRAIKAVFEDVDEQEAKLAFVEGVFQRSDEDEKEVADFLETLNGLSDERKDAEFDAWVKARTALVSEEEGEEYRALTEVLLEKYDPMVRLNEQNARHQIESSHLSISRFVKGWANLPREVPFKKDKGELAKGSVTMLRAVLGTARWNELVDFISQLMTVDPDMEGNFVWPPVSGSGQTPSSTPTSSTKAKKESGKSTAEATA